MVPDEAFGVRERLRQKGRADEAVNLHLSALRVRDWTAEVPFPHPIDTKEISVVLPEAVSASVSENSDVRTFWLRIGDRLAYRIDIAKPVGSEEEITRLALMGFFMLGIERYAEARDALIEDRVHRSAKFSKKMAESL